jgi:hypothetical protein
MAGRAMDTYLNDHLGGAKFGSDLAEQIRDRHEGTPLGEAMESVATEIERDRQTLLELMERMGTQPNPVKQATGWLAEKVSRLKFEGTMASAPDHGAFMALETLALGVEGKASMWRALKEVAGDYPSLATTNLDELIDRAEAQSATIDREWIVAGTKALGNPEPTTPERVNAYSAENPPTDPGRPAFESAFS